MANVRKGHTTKVVGMSAWWRHLRSYGKRKFWKRQRRADKMALRRDNEQGRDHRPDSRTTA